MTTVVMLLVRHSHGQGLSPWQPGEENAGRSAVFLPHIRSASGGGLGMIRFKGLTNRGSYSNF